MPNSTEANRQKYLPFFDKCLQKYGIVTNNQIAAFFAQVGHESINLSAVVENLNYSATRLLSIFPKYFNAGNVYNYANQPAKIANRAYANRMGNGTEASGDGWKYRGRGLIQLTGKTNYANLKADSGIDFVTKPALLEQPENAVISACWYWNKVGLNKIAQ